MILRLKEQLRFGTGMSIYGFMTHQLTVEELLALNNNPNYIGRVNCYGMAVGITLEEAYRSPVPNRQFPGDFSSAFSDNAVGASMRVWRQNLYGVLTDGMTPITRDQAETTDGHIIAFQDRVVDFHFRRRVPQPAKPTVWLEKTASKPITIVEANFVDWKKNYIFFCVPEDRLHMGAHKPNGYSDVTARAIGQLLQEHWVQHPDRRREIEREVIKLGLETQLAGLLNSWAYHRENIAPYIPTGYSNIRVQAAWPTI